MNAIILAGGQNKRIGLKKAFLEIGGKKIIERMAEALKPIFTDVIIIAKDVNEFASLRGVTVRGDAFEGHSSLIGIYSGLLHSKSKYNFFFACDMPFLNSNLIDYMIGLCDGHDVVIPKFQGKYEALHVVYSKACLKPFEKKLKKGLPKIIDAFNGLKVREVTDEEIKRLDPKGLSFFNVNTPEDYEKAQRLAAE